MKIKLDDIKATSLGIIIMCHFVFSASHSPKAKQSTDAKTPSSAKDVKPSHSKTDKKSDPDRNASLAQSSQIGYDSKLVSQSQHVNKLKTDDHNKQLSGQMSKSGTGSGVSHDHVGSKVSRDPAGNTSETQVGKVASAAHEKVSSATSDGNPAGQDLTKNQHQLSSPQDHLENTAASSAKVRTVSPFSYALLGKIISKEIFCGKHIK